MTKRIFRSICIVVLSVLLSSVVMTLGALYRYFSQVQLQQLRTEVTLAAQGVASNGLAYFDGLDSTDCRITWIAADGTVLYDSQHSTGAMPNHLQREEIREALDTGYGESTRYSDTIMEQSFYAALRLQDGTVLRLSNQQDSVVTLLLGILQPMLFILAASILMALLLASRLSAHVVKPLNSLDLDVPLANSGYPEISPLLRRLDAQQKQLREQEALLSHRQKQFDTVTRSMNEGLVLLDNKTTILSINPAAVRLLDAEKNCIGSDFITLNRTKEVCELVYTALNGQKGEKNIRLRYGTYHMISSPVRADGIVSGVVLLLFDITENQKAEELRREFTANVSHELKSPLHAISGYAELLTNGMLPLENAGHAAEKIYTEAQRMIYLVEDILRLSRLDDGGEDMTWCSTDIFQTAQDVAAKLASAAELGNISLRLEGSSVTIRTIPQLLEGILFNLTDNAIKYNRSGGSVTLRVSHTDTAVVLTVADTGIGIEEGHQERIFERFYRVDKSHSKAVGGTGLGLSITKHACQILGAAIGLQSTPGIGTTVTVTFPK